MNTDHIILLEQADSSATECARDLPEVDDAPFAGEYVGRAASPAANDTAGGPRRRMDVRANLVDVFAGINAFVRYRYDAVRRQVSAHRRRMGSYVTFARELGAAPRAIGAVCPSSPHLARAMAGGLGELDGGLVVELGAGTGNITHALLQQGIAPACLIAVERSPAMAAYLRTRFPDIRVIVGDARHLDTLLGDDVRKVRAVVSGLPLRALPRAVVQSILQQVRQLLPEDGVFVQFTYDLRMRSIGDDSSLKKADSRVIWRNIPPARVDTFVRQAPGAMARAAGPRPHGN